MSPDTQRKAIRTLGDTLRLIKKRKAEAGGLTENEKASARQVLKRTDAIDFEVEARKRRGRRV